MRNTATHSVDCLVASPPWRRKQAGFTLVELLVVIGIIAVLVAMLLPALNKARFQANLISCASNLRQLGMVMMQYANDNQGAVPTGFWWTAFPQNNIFYANSGGGLACPNTPLNQYSPVCTGPLGVLGLAHLLPGATTQNPLGDIKPFFCPLETDPFLSYNTPQNPWPISPPGFYSYVDLGYGVRPLYTNIPNTTGPNGYESTYQTGYFNTGGCGTWDLTTWPWTRRSAKLNQLKSFTALAADMFKPIPVGNGNNPPNSYSEPQCTPSTGHVYTGVNVFYADGSVLFVPYGAYKNDYTNYVNGYNGSMSASLLTPNSTLPATGGVWYDLDQYHH